MNPLTRIKLILKSPKFDKKFLTWVFKFLGVLSIFLIFVFPSQRELGNLSANLNSLKNQITNVKKISINLLTPEELRETEDRVKEFESKLIDSTQASALLGLISDQADKNHFNIIQIFSESPISIKDEVGKDMEFEGKKLHWLPVNFRIETDYKNLGNFLKSLKDEAKASFLVESLNIEKTASRSESLQCDITLSFVAK